MNLQEYLFDKLAEEAAEVIQRCMKINRFGLGETQAGEQRDNVQRLINELQDMQVAASLLVHHGVAGLQPFCSFDSTALVSARRVAKYALYSYRLGTLQLANDELAYLWSLYDGTQEEIDALGPLSAEQRGNQSGHRQA